MRTISHLRRRPDHIRTFPHSYLEAAQYNHSLICRSVFTGTFLSFISWWPARKCKLMYLNGKHMSWSQHVCGSEHYAMPKIRVRSLVGVVDGSQNSGLSRRRPGSRPACGVFFSPLTVTLLSRVSPFKNVPVNTYQ